MEDNITLLAAAKYEKDLCKKLFDKNGKIEITDLALLSGAVVNNNVEYYIWTKSGDNDNGVVVLKVPFENNNWSHNTTEFDSYRRGATILPTITSPDVFNDVISRNNNDEDYFEVEYGEYPQYVPDRQLQTRLLGALLHGEMSGTGKTYTFGSVIRDVLSEPINLKIYDEYEYEGRRFIYYESKNKYGKNAIYPGMRLKNGMEYDIFDKFFVEVLPVKWIVDKKHQRLVCKSCLLSGIPFTETKEYGGIDTFSQTSIKKYMEKYMFRDIMQNVDTYSLNSSMSKVKNINGLNFDKVSEEDIIKGAIEAGIAVFLHGRSSEGKSARVKEIDPTCEIIYLRNATPESLNGKSVYKESTGEMIDIKPTWLKRLEEKCTNEPDKYHVVFFDELTNALPSIQGMAFNIVLDREVNGMWKLPENARIVAAGNDIDDSLAANQLAEPLFNRFAHVYITTTPENWLKWAIENNIHPAIVSYIAYKKDKVLRTKYTGEKPNADPRKWEMASKVLYATRKPEMLRSLIGEEITKEFIAFCNQSVITIEDVLNDNYDYLEVIMANVGKMYATVSSLSQVDEEHVEKVRNFVKKCGPEYTATFDTLWAHGDEHRLEKLAELQMDNEVFDEKIKSDINIEDVELTLLSLEDVCDEKHLNVLDNYGSVAAITDLVIITGGYVYDDNYRAPDDKSLKGRIGLQHTGTFGPGEDVGFIDENGDFDFTTSFDDHNAIRPVLISSSIFSYIFPNRRSGYKGTYEVEFGEYPQYVPNDDIQKELNNETAFKLKKTGRNYKLLQYELPFDEYKYRGRKYVRCPKITSTCVSLSNNHQYIKGEYVWLEVSPITWLIDETTGTLISKRCLLSGIKFNDRVRASNFENTEMYRFLNEHMKRDMFQSEELFKTQENENVKMLVKRAK